MDSLKKFIKDFIPEKFLIQYHRIRLYLWSRKNLPQVLYVADTDYVIPGWAWQTAIPCTIETTQIHYTGSKRKIARMFYEPVELPIFKNMIKDKMVFFDVGSNIGYYCCIAAYSGVKKVFGFEFARDYAIFSQEKVIKKNNISGQIYNVGIGEKNSSEVYSDPMNTSHGKMKSLDQFAEELGCYPDAIKMDIEGFELDALRGASKVLANGPDLDISIHMEFLKERGQSADQVLDLLQSYGYKTIWSQGDTYFMTTNKASSIN